MAQKKSYPEDLMLDAVLKYADRTEGKIRLSELAVWASENIAGLKGIKYFHFNAKRTKKDPRTGKKEKSYTEAYLRVQELNRSRENEDILKSNPILHSSDVDAFLELPVTEQRRCFLAARDTVWGITRENSMLKSQNKLLQGEIRETVRRSAELAEVIEKISKAQNTLDRKVTLFLRLVGEEQRKLVMRRAGILDDGFDLLSYETALKDDVREAFRIANAIQPVLDVLKEMDTESTDSPFSRATESEIIDTIIGGIDI